MNDIRKQRAGRYPQAYGPEEHRRALDRIIRDIKTTDFEASRRPDGERRARTTPITGRREAANDE